MFECCSIVLIMGNGDNLFIVTINKPYYPSVEYFSSLEDAWKYRAELIKDESSEDGVYDVTVTVARILSDTFIKTDF